MISIPLLARRLLWRQHGNDRPAQSHGDPLPPLYAPALREQRHGEVLGILLSCPGICSRASGISPLPQPGQVLDSKSGKSAGCSSQFLDASGQLLHTATRGLAAGCACKGTGGYAEWYVCLQITICSDHAEYPDLKLTTFGTKPIFEKLRTVRNCLCACPQSSQSPCPALAWTGGVQGIRKLCSAWELVLYQDG